ncbi:HK97-gp10 family putative phage morphogenesis protein [Celeribacter indicus]|uniref:Phage protein, HK97, gp10 n=1 Tax=Celeribacter indicus TaxID=1208324 RepID=A0A0B5E1C1_9RHOB|nr:HK97-gp10 family putative phage morphogenesis protein [Celeribacter indicus]AJE47185.1 Phage protein, HK97, gp10 [Celeribacter indicus]SDW00259.1 phage protein, HK97 gp10 family [Celeribacter indicus]
MEKDGGLSKFQKRMQAIPKDVRAAVKPALVRNAEEMARTMRTMVPEETGKLKESILVTGPGESTPPYSQPGGSQSVGLTQAAVTAGNSDARYAHLVEYGHSNGFMQGAEQGTRGQEVPAKPFFWPAVRLHRKKAASSIKRAISKAVKESGK